MRTIVLLSGRSHPKLAAQLAERLGIDLAAIKLGEFSNKETSVEIKHNVRDKDVFILQSGCGNINSTLMELLIIIHACKIASARRITAVIPCFPYARQPDAPYTSNSSSRRADLWQARPGTLMANLLTAAGVNHIITMELHDAQFQGFFDIPVDNLMSAPLMLRYIVENIPAYKDAVIVSPDSGGAKRATLVAEKLGMDFGLVHKERKKDNAKKSDDADQLVFVGDVNNKVAIIVDDIIDTAATITVAASVLIKFGATRVYAVITHGILSGNAVELINKSHLHEVAVSTSVPQAEHMAACSKLRTFEVAPIFAEAIRRIHNGESVSFLFDHVPH